MSTSTTPAWTTPQHEPEPSRRLGPSLLLPLGVLVLALAAAAAGGWGWWSWWSPAPNGEIARRVDTGAYGWYAKPFDPGQAHVASSTFEYVVIGFALAVVVGLLSGLAGRNRALLALAAVVIASAAAAAVMWSVGMAFSPPDPSRFADAEHYGNSYPGALTIGGWTPYLVWPLGMLFGFLVVMLTMNSESQTPEPLPPAPAPPG